MKKNFMIFGGNFINKGAQAMVFVTVDELRRRYPDCNIHVYTNLNYRENQKQYRFRIYDDLFIHMGAQDKMKYFVVAAAKAVLGRPAALKSFLTYHYYRRKYTAMLDISGYALSSQWKVSSGIVRTYLENIEIAHNNGTPVFLMPQSVGPFDFGENQEMMDRRIAKTIGGVQKIFIRERECFNLFQEKYDLKNAVLSPDIVLQNRELNKKNIFRDVLGLRIPVVDTENSIAIVPNLRTIDQNNERKEKVLNIYGYFVKAVLEQGKQVYLVRHSYEDINACRMIKERFSEDERVHVIEEELNCFEYEEFIAKFGYIIAARFHAVVHAYKQGVPAIVVGWAAKYNGLVQLFNQEKYVIDIRKDISKEQVDKLIREISESYKEERKCILESLEDIQQNNCFDILSETLEGIS